MLQIILSSRGGPSRFLRRSELLSMSEKIPIVCVGDWHGDQNWGIRAIKSAARSGAKTIVHVGDFGLDFPGPKRGRYESKLNRYLVEYGMTLVLSPGNHDNAETVSRLEIEDDGLAYFRSNIKILPKGGRTTIDELHIGGLGGAFSIDQAWRREGKDWWPDEEPTEEEAKRLLGGGSIDILITHDVPAGVPVRSSLNLTPEMRKRAERTRTLLREVVDEVIPSHVFCGHWHQRLIHYLNHADGSETRVDVLNMENSREGNAVLLWPGDLPLLVEPLIIGGT